MIKQLQLQVKSAAHTTQRLSPTHEKQPKKKTTITYNIMEEEVAKLVRSDMEILVFYLLTTFSPPNCRTVFNYLATMYLTMTKLMIFELSNCNTLLNEISKLETRRT